MGDSERHGTPETEGRTQEGVGKRRSIGIKTGNENKNVTHVSEMRSLRKRLIELESEKNER